MNAQATQLGRIDGYKTADGGAKNVDEIKTKTPPGDAAGQPGAKTPTLSEVKGGLDAVHTKLEELAARTESNQALTAQLDGVKTAISSFERNLERFVADGPPADWSANLEAIGSRLDAIEAGAAMPGGARADGVKTTGQIIHGAKGWKSYQPADAEPLVIPKGRFGEKLAIPSMIPQAHGYKTGEVMTGYAYGLAPNPVQVRPGVITPSLEAMDLASRIMYVPAPGAISWLSARETDISVHGNVTTTLTVAVTNPSTTCTVQSAEGFLPGTIARFWDDTAGLLKKVEIVSVDYDTNVITFGAGALDFVASIGWRVTCDNFGAVSQGVRKHFSHLDIEQVEQSFKTIPTMLAVTEQMINTAPALTAWIEQRLQFRARRNLSHHLLHGDGTKPRQLAGLDNFAGALSYLWSSGVSGDTMVDAVLRAIAMIPWSGQITVVLNKLDLMKIGTSKGTDGHYIKTTVFGDLQIQAAAGRMFLGPWEIILDDSCPEGDFYVINLSEASELVDQQRSMIAFGYVDGQFAENAITARYEDHLIHSINLPAFVLGEFDGPVP